MAARLSSILLFHQNQMRVVALINYRRKIHLHNKSTMRIAFTRHQRDVTRAMKRVGRSDPFRPMSSRQSGSVHNCSETVVSRRAKPDSDFAAIGCFSGCALLMLSPVFLFIFALSSPDDDTRSSTSTTVTIGEQYYTKAKCIGSSTKDDLTTAFTLVSNKDMEAFDEMVSQRRTVVIAENSRVTVHDSTFRFASVTVSGSSQRLWVYVDWLE